MMLSPSSSGLVTVLSQSVAGGIDEPLTAGSRSRGRSGLVTDGAPPVGGGRIRGVADGAVSAVEMSIALANRLSREVLPPLRQSQQQPAGTTYGMWILATVAPAHRKVDTRV